MMYKVIDVVTEKVIARVQVNRSMCNDEILELVADEVVPDIPFKDDFERNVRICNNWYCFDDLEIVDDE